MLDEVRVAPEADGAGGVDDPLSVVPGTPVHPTSNANPPPMTTMARRACLRMGGMYSA